MFCNQIMVRIEEKEEKKKRMGLQNDMRGRIEALKAEHI